jgi:hypothetical protein
VALSKSRTAEAYVVERARIILACLEGKEIQQVAEQLRVSCVRYSGLAHFATLIWPTLVV